MRRPTLIIITLGRESWNETVFIHSTRTLHKAHKNTNKTREEWKKNERWVEFSMVVPSSDEVRVRFDLSTH